MRLVFIFRLPLVWAFFILSLLLFPAVPRLEGVASLAVDKLLHFLIFFPLPLWWLLAWQSFKPEQFSSRLPLRRVILVVAICLVFGAATEVLQDWLTLSRRASLGDFFANAWGILAGAALFLFLRGLFLKTT